jgi:hypothetical protein
MGPSASRRRSRPSALILALVAPIAALLLAASGSALDTRTPEGEIAYSLGSSSGPACIDAVSLKRQVPRTLVCGPYRALFEALGSDAAWSPDGTRLAYLKTRSKPGVYVVSSDGTGAHRVAPLASLDANYRINVSPGSWSPDGSQIAFDRWPETEYVACTHRKAFRLRLAIAQVSPTKLKEIPVLPKPSRMKLLEEVDWSPSANELLYVLTTEHLTHSLGETYCDPTSSSLYAMDTDGGNRRLLFTARGEIRRATWSPDGSAIVIASCSRKASPGCGVYIVSRDGSQSRLLTAFNWVFADKLVWTGNTIYLDPGVFGVLIRIDATSGRRQRVSVPQRRTGMDCQPEQGALLAVSGDGAWIAILSREYFVFDDCKDPYKAVVALIPVAGRGTTWVPVAPARGIIDWLGLYLK